MSDHSSDHLRPDAFPDAWEMREPGMKRLAAEKKSEWTKETEAQYRYQLEVARRWFELGQEEEGDLNAH